jgi:hypothetical protein
MINKANGRTRSPKLSREFLSQLDPKLRAAYSDLSDPLAWQIASLVDEARFERIHPNMVLKFGYLYATAERRARGQEASKEHRRRSRLELAGEIHGLETGYRGEAEARRRYRRGRRALQQTKTSIDAVAKRWRAFRDVVKKYRPDLPVHLHSRFSEEKLRDVWERLHEMEISTVVDEDDLAAEEVSRERSAIAQTYIWWWFKIPRYRGKWNDMQLLAFAWRMSVSESVASFRTVVRRICKAASCTDSFGDPWDSLFSEKV